MTDTVSVRLLLRLQATGANVNLWGELLDAALQLLDDAVAGMADITLTGDYAPVRTNFVTDESRAAILKFGGTLSANATITIASVSKLYVIWNNTNKNLVITTGSGLTVTVDAGDIIPILCDGTNVRTIMFGGLNLKDYITAYAASAGAVPSPLGNALKFLYTADGVNVTWRQPSTLDLSDYADQILGVQVALAFAASRRR